MPNSQYILVAIVLLLALVYVGRRIFSRLSSLIRQNRAGNSSCASACGSCGPSPPTKIHSH